MSNPAARYLGIPLASKALIILTPSMPPSRPPNPCKAMKKYSPPMFMKRDPIIAPAARHDMIDVPISMMGSTHFPDNISLYATRVVIESNKALAAVNPRKWNEPGLRIR